MVKCLHGLLQKPGSLHALMQRCTALALLPLPFWLLAFFDRLSHLPHAQMSAWLSAPWNLAFLLLTLLLAIYHAGLGVQSILDDYVHSDSLKKAALLATRILLWASLLATVVAIANLG